MNDQEHACFDCGRPIPLKHIRCNLCYGAFVDADLRGANHQGDNLSNRRPDQSEAQSVVKFASGAISSKIPRLELIPPSTLRALAKRMERGIRIKGDGAWNALANQAPVHDKVFVMERLAHCVDHCYKAIARIAGTLEPSDAEDVADGGDAGAILYAGALLAEYCRVVPPAKEKGIGA